MNNDTDEQDRISQLYADNKAAFQAAQESANKGDWQSFEKTPVTNDTPADAMQLKPCPFCGDTAKHIERHNPMSKWRHSVDCEQCGASGPVEATKTEAIAAWNTRTTSLAAQDGLVDALNAVHFYIDASDLELQEVGMSRTDALTHARRLRSAALASIESLNNG